MSGDEFTKLFKYMSERFDKIDKTLEAKADATDIRKSLELLDEVAKKQELDNDERLIMGHQLDRLDRWIHELADKIGHDLSSR